MPTPAPRRRVGDRAGAPPWTGPRALTIALTLGLLLLVAGAPFARATSSPTPNPSRTGSAAGSIPSTTATASSVPQAGGSGKARPLLVVLDLSGSMGEQDENGVVKLAGAQASLIDLIRQLPDGASTGLWTYPGGTSAACSPGHLSTPVGPVDPVSMSAQIRSFKAAGDTPTAEALRAAVDSLRAAGYTAGTVLLVSDGESTCEPPCDVAKELVNSGFDLTVQSLGFRISTAGADELSCIADATGGTYASIDDSAALQKTLIDAARPALTVAVRADATVPPSSRTTLSATVSNTSALDAHNVTVSLTFARPPDASLGLPFDSPVVDVPRQALGNLPTGGTLTRSWTLSSGPPVSLAWQATWKVVVTSADAGAVAKTGLMTFSNAPLGIRQAGPVLRVIADRGGRLAILGDSFSAGEGAKTYSPESNRPANRCHRSPLTYAMSLFDDAHKPELVACSGAVVADFYSPKASEAGETAQLTHLRTLDPTPDGVLMTVGGNDIGFTGIIVACLLPGNCADDQVPAPDVLDRCLLVDGTFLGVNCYVPRREDVFATIAAQRGRLTQVYEDVAATVNSSTARRSRGGRIAQVLVLAYPQMFPNQRASCFGFSGPDAAFGNDVVDRLNTVVREAVGNAAKAGYPVQLVENVRDAMLPNHTVCDTKPWANRFDIVAGAVGKLTPSVRDKELMHPNALGYAAMTSALVQWSQRAKALPLTAAIEPDLELATGGGTPVGTVDLQGANGGTLQGGPAPGSTGGAALNPTGVPAGGALRVRAAGFAAGAPVTVTVRSSPVALALVYADHRGLVDAVVTVPSGLVRGRHTLLAQGTSRGGRPRVAFAALDVRDRLPWWVRPLEGSSGAALLLAGSLAFRGRRRRRAGSPADGDKP